MAKFKHTQKEMERVRKLQRALGYSIRRLCLAVTNRTKEDFQSEAFQVYQMIDELEELGKWD